MLQFIMKLDLGLLTEISKGMSRDYKIDIRCEKVSEEKLCDVCGGFLPDVDEQEIKELSTTRA